MWVDSTPPGYVWIATCIHVLFINMYARTCNNDQAITIVTMDVHILDKEHHNLIICTWKVKRVL